MKTNILKNECPTAIGQVAKSIKSITIHFIATCAQLATTETCLCVCYLLLALQGVLIVFGRAL